MPASPPSPPQAETMSTRAVNRVVRPSALRSWGWIRLPMSPLANLRYAPTRLMTKSSKTKIPLARHNLPRNPKRFLRRRGQIPRTRLMNHAPHPFPENFTGGLLLAANHSSNICPQNSIFWLVRRTPDQREHYGPPTDLPPASRVHRPVPKTSKRSGRGGPTHLTAASSSSRTSPLGASSLPGCCKTCGRLAIRAHLCVDASPWGRDSTGGGCCRWASWSPRRWSR